MKKKVAVITAITTMSPVMVMAQESGTANTAVVSAMQTTANDMLATGASILPIALSVVGLLLVVRFGLKLFKSVSK